MYKLKFILATAVLLLGGSGAAFAATGHVPDTVKTLIGSSSGSSVSGNQNTGTTTQAGQETSAAQDQYSGGGVSTIAQDKSATGTMTLPNGKEIDNHGLAVSQAAKAQQSDAGNADQSQTQSQQGEDNSGNQTQTHASGESGVPSSLPTVPTPQGGQHGRP